MSHSLMPTARVGHLYRRVCRYERNDPKDQNKNKKKGAVHKLTEATMDPRQIEHLYPLSRVSRS